MSTPDDKPAPEATPAAPADATVPAENTSPPAQTTDSGQGPASTTDVVETPSPAPTVAVPATVAVASPPPSNPHIERIKQGVKELEAGQEARGIEDVFAGLEGLAFGPTSLPSNSRWTGIQWEVRRHVEALLNKL